jgi:hypothetical protein
MQYVTRYYKPKAEELPLYEEKNGFFLQTFSDWPHGARIKSTLPRRQLRYATISCGGFRGDASDDPFFILNLQNRRTNLFPGDEFRSPSVADAENLVKWNALPRLDPTVPDWEGDFYHHCWYDWVIGRTSAMLSNTSSPTFRRVFVYVNRSVSIDGVGGAARPRRRRDGRDGRGRLRL